MRQSKQEEENMDCTCLRVGDLLELLVGADCEYVLAVDAQTNARIAAILQHILARTFASYRVPLVHGYRQAQAILIMFLFDSFYFTSANLRPCRKK